eukprot:gene22617-27298_t
MRLSRTLVPAVSKRSQTAQKESGDTAGASGAGVAAPAEKVVWIQTTNKQVLTAAVEAGFDTFVFPNEEEEDLQRMKEWSALARIRPRRLLERSVDGQQVFDIVDENERWHGSWSLVDSAEAAEATASMSTGEGHVVMDARDWQIIPAENLVAAFQGSAAVLLAVAQSYDAACAMLGALEVGTDGVVLVTEDPLEVQALSSFLLQRRSAM